MAHAARSLQALLDRTSQMETNQAQLAKIMRALTDSAEGHLLLADGDVRNQQPLHGGLFKYLHPQSLSKLLSSSQHQRSSKL